MTSDYALTQEDLDSDPILKDLGAPVPMDPVELQDRITLNFQFHHEHWGDQPYPVCRVASVMLQSKEQPYYRRQTIDEQWKSLHLGWMETPDKVSFVTVENLVGGFTPTQPTEQQRLAMECSVIQVRFVDSPDYVRIRPGWPYCCEPNDASRLQLRCEQGTAEVRVSVFPR